MVISKIQAIPQKGVLSLARNKYDVDEELKNEFNVDHLKRLYQYIKPYKKIILLTIFLMIISSILSLTGPYLLKLAIDTMIPEKNVYGILILGFIYLLTIILASLCLKKRLQYMAKLGQQIIHSIRSDCFAQLQKLPFTYYDNRPHGKIIIRVVNYVNSISDLLSNGIIDMITSLFTLIFIIIFMFFLNVKLTLITLATIPVLVFSIMLIKKAQRRAWQNQSRKQSNLTAYMHESILGMKITQSFVREKFNFGIFSDLSITLRASWMKAVMVQNLMPIIIGTLEFFSVALIYLIGLYWGGGLLIEIGVLTAFINYVSRFWQPISNLGNFYNSIVNSMAYLERIFETIDEKPTVTDIEGASIMPHIKGNVEFKNVCFGYEDNNLILDNLNFKVNQGESIALVGPTGAGKTTIINLLSRFYNLTSGQLLIDGIDISTVTLNSLRTQMGVMLQDTFIFSGTIADNIRYAKLDATDEEIMNAAKIVRAHEFIEKFEYGYQTQVNERGSRLSAGQRQLLSFARALLADPKILILDEATSSIDTATEKNLQEGLNALLKGRTSFIIAHRLSTIKNASRIMVIDNKNIIEQGSHDDLINLQGAYHNLYTAQFAFLN